MLHYKARQSQVANKENKKLWYPITVSSKELVSTRKIAREIAARSGASEGDVFGVLHDLGAVMREHLSDGKRVKLDGIGSFKLIARAKGNGVEKEEAVSASQFNSVRVAFVPESESSRTLGTKTFSLIAPDLRFAPYVAKPQKPKPNPGPGGGGTGGEPGAGV